MKEDFAFITIIITVYHFPMFSHLVSFKCKSGHWTAHAVSHSHRAVMIHSRICGGNISPLYFSLRENNTFDLCFQESPLHSKIIQKRLEISSSRKQSNCSLVHLMRSTVADSYSGTVQSGGKKSDEPICQLLITPCGKGSFSERGHNLWSGNTFRGLLVMLNEWADQPEQGYSFISAHCKSQWNKTADG